MRDLHFQVHAQLAQRANPPMLLAGEVIDLEALVQNQLLQVVQLIKAEAQLMQLLFPEVHDLVLEAGTLKETVVVHPEVKAKEVDLLATR